MPKNLTDLLPGQKSYLVGCALFVIGILKLALPDHVLPIEGSPEELMGLGAGIIFLRSGLKKHVAEVIASKSADS